MFRLRFHNIRGGVLAFSICVLGALWLPATCWAAKPAPIALTQFHINDFAAYCQTAIIDLRDCSAAHRPSESAQAYVKRMGGYLSALIKVEKQTEPIRVMPILQDNSPSNRKTWSNVCKEAYKLPQWVTRLDLLWRKRDHVPLTHIGDALLRSKICVEAMENGLRNARP